MLTVPESVEREVDDGPRGLVHASVHQPQHSTFGPSPSSYCATSVGYDRVTGRRASSVVP